MSVNALDFALSLMPEYRRAQKADLDPKPKTEADGTIVDANGDVIMDSADGVKEERDTPAPSINGMMNGTISNGTDHDELESSLGRANGHGEGDGDVNGEDGDDSGSESLSDPDMPDDGPNIAAASRRKAMKEKAVEREAEEAMRAARVVEDRIKAKESKHISSEKKRLQDEIDALTQKLRMLDHDFRSHLYTLRARPLGSDRFGNKVWWMDGLGSAPLMGENGKVTWGTGRLYLQGAEDLEAGILSDSSGDHNGGMREQESQRGRRGEVGSWRMEFIRFTRSGEPMPPIPLTRMPQY